MSGFNSRTTGLPGNIEIWLRAEPLEHGHSRYRAKIKKNGKWSAIFLVGSDPKQVKNIDDGLLDREIREIQHFIVTHKSALVNLIDNKIDSAECGMAIMKKRGEL
jgi:hypothetical protein